MAPLPAEYELPMDSKWTYQHGRLDPGLERTVDLVEGVKATPPARGEAGAAGWSGGDDASRGLQPEQEAADDSVGPGSRTHAPPNGHTPADIPTIPPRSPLTSLPSELVNAIISFLSPIGLVAVSATCRSLAVHARSDISWQRHVQENIPGLTLTTPFPCKTYRELYIAHDPHWFLPRYKLWFCDYFLTGKMIICRYDPRRGCIEGYRLVCERPAPTFDPWDADNEVIIHSFDPKVSLHMDQPVLQLNANTLENLIISFSNSRREQRFCAETPMRIDHRRDNGVFSNFLLTRPVEQRSNMQLWPPDTIPATQRVRNASQEGFVGVGHKPQKRSEVSDRAFRIRRWMEMTAGTSAPGLHLGEEVYTYATLEPWLYTPTKEKPYRGIFVGDYSGHGCEFLLMHQPQDEEEFDESKIIQQEDETVQEWETRKEEERVNRGSLYAIKLTGDPNVPRGEYTFVVDDLSSNGYVRTAAEKPFVGSRIVRSRGHIAARMFRNDKFIASELIMISPNRLAQHWIGFGHISFYERVDIDSFLSPFNDPPPCSPAPVEEHSQMPL